MTLGVRQQHTASFSDCRFVLRRSEHVMQWQTNWGMVEHISSSNQRKPTLLFKLLQLINSPRIVNASVQLRQQIGAIAKKLMILRQRFSTGTYLNLHSLVFILIFTSSVKPCATSFTFKKPLAARMRFVEVSNSNSITTNARDHASQQAD